MTKRIPKFAAAAAAISALVLGGAVFAQAQPRHAAAHEKTSKVDRDNIRSGDQTTPDRTTKVRHATIADPAGTGTSQSADQTAPGTSPSTETAGTESETATASDGPGGHADEPANVSADHQFSGVE